MFVSPYDDAAIIAGAGTVALELLEDAPQVDMLVMPVGGGGLISGMAVVARARRPDVEIVGVEADRYPSMANAVRSEHAAVGGTTVAEGIAVPIAGLADRADRRSARRRHRHRRARTTSRRRSISSSRSRRSSPKVRVARVSRRCSSIRRGFAVTRVGIVVTGGNIDPRVLATILLRGLVRSGRLARLRVEISDVPGALGKVSSIVGEVGGNIVDVAHQRLFSDVSIKSAILELAVETRDRVHAERAHRRARPGRLPHRAVGRNGPRRADPIDGGLTCAPSSRPRHSCEAAR